MKLRLWFTTVGKQLQHICRHHLMPPLLLRAHYQCPLAHFLLGLLLDPPRLRSSRPHPSRSTSLSRKDYLNVQSSRFHRSSIRSPASATSTSTLLLTAFLGHFLKPSQIHAPDVGTCSNGREMRVGMSKCQNIQNIEGAHAECLCFGRGT